MQSADDVLKFWFEEAGPGHWFKQSDDFDAICRQRFLDTLQAAAQGECWHWRASAAGRAAEIIVLDQLSRNVYRGTADAWAQDGMSLALAQEAVHSGDHLQMTADQRYFTYMPYMHSESVVVHEEALRLFTELDKPEALRYEQLHRDVILRFGRYPSRNAALNRPSTPQELAYLADGGVF